MPLVSVISLITALLVILGLIDTPYYRLPLEGAPGSFIMECRICSNELQEADHIKCSSCLALLHYSCAGLSEKDFGRILPMNKIKWKCCACKEAKNKKMPVSTPTSQQNPKSNVIPQFVLTGEKSSKATITTLQTPADPSPVVSLPLPLLAPTELNTSESLINFDTRSFMAYIDAKFAALQKSWQRDIDSALTKIQSQLDIFSAKYAGWEARISAMEEKVSSTAISEDVQQLLTDNKAMKATIANLELGAASLEKRVEDMDQSARSCNLEIQNIPEVKNENLNQVVFEIGKLIGVEIDADKVRAVHRVARGPGAAPGPAAAAADAPPPRPKNIVVQLSSRRLRDDVLSAARARRELYTDQLQMGGESRRFFVAEHLTLRNKKLFAKARELGKDAGFKHVWVRNFTIQMRKTDLSKIIYIRSESDLARFVSV